LRYPVTDELPLRVFPYPPRGSRLPDSVAPFGPGSCGPPADGNGFLLPAGRSDDGVLRERARSGGLLRELLPPVRARGGRARASIAGGPDPRGAFRDRLWPAASAAHGLPRKAGAPRRAARPIGPSLPPLRRPRGL